MGCEVFLTQSNPVQLHFDLNAIKEISIKGVRRAAAFLAIGLSSTADPSKVSLHLPSASMWRFLPDGVPDEEVRRVVAEFQNWIVGNALRELDASFSVFLDQVWAVNEWLKLHGTAVRSDHKIKSIEADTNAANKYERILHKLGADDPDISKLQSLSTFRNCLTHARGVVTDRHVNGGTSLTIRWLALEIRLQQGNRHVVVPHKIGPTGIQAPDPSMPADVVGVVVERSRSFGVGTQAKIEASDLHEICWFYLNLTDRIVAKLTESLAARGIPKTVPQSMQGRAPSA